MPQQVIDIPGVGEVEFPDTMSDADVSAAAKKLFEQHQPPPSANAMMSRAASTNNQPEGGPHEPDTWGGGFLKSIKDQVAPAFSGRNSALAGAAQPQSVGDFLSLIVPSGVSEAVAPASRLAKAGVQGAREGKGLLGSIRGGMKGMKEAAKTVNVRDVASQNFNRQPLANQMADLPLDRPAPLTGGRTSPPPNRVDVTPSTNDLPLYMQQEMMEQAAPVARAPAARMPASPPEPPAELMGAAGPPRPAPAAAEGLEDMLTEGMLDSRINSMPPSDMVASPPGAWKQSQAQMEMEGRLSGRQPASAPEAALTEPPQLGGPAEPISSAPDVLPSEAGGAGGGATGALDTSAFTPEDWADLRGRLGARDAARLTGKTPEEIRQLSGGGPSRVPSEAQDRIRAYEERMRQE